MARACSVCTHLRVSEIDSEIIRGASYRDIAGRFDVSKSAVGLHALSHVPEALARAADAASRVTAAGLVAQLQGLYMVGLEILEETRESGNHTCALHAIARLEKLVELQGRVAGELVDRQIVEQRSSAFDSQWLELRALILRALVPHPEAAAAVRSALAAVAGGDAS